MVLAVYETTDTAKIPYLNWKSQAYLTEPVQLVNRHKEFRLAFS